LSELTHKNNLLVGLKNDVEQIDTLEPHFDFAVNEECAKYNECQAYAPFLFNNKSVYHVEYNLRKASTTCKTVSTLYPHLISIVKPLNLDKRVVYCT
jgi:hypothetical protein